MCLNRLGSAYKRLIASDSNRLLTFRLNVRFLMLLSRIRRRYAGRSINVFVLHPITRLGDNRIRVTRIKDERSNTFKGGINARMVLRAFQYVVFYGLRRLICRRFLRIAGLDIRLVIGLQWRDLINRLKTTNLSGAKRRALASGGALREEENFREDVLRVANLIARSNARRFLFQEEVQFALQDGLASGSVAQFSTNARAGGAIFIGIFDHFLACIEGIENRLFRAALHFTGFREVFFCICENRGILAGRAFVRCSDVLVIVTLPQRMDGRRILARYGFSIFN